MKQGDIEKEQERITSWWNEVMKEFFNDDGVLKARIERRGIWYFKRNGREA